MGKAKVWRRKGSAHDAKHTSSSVKHSGGRVMVLACMAASGVASLIFIDDVNPDGNSRMNSEVYKNILSANLRRNASVIGGETSSCSKTMTQNTLQHKKGLHEGEKLEGFRQAKSITRPSPNRACISPPEEMIEGETSPKHTPHE